MLLIESLAFEFGSLIIGFVNLVLQTCALLHITKSTFEKALFLFGLLFGLGVFARYQKEGAAFLPKYDAMLASCGSGTIAEVAASVGIDVRSVDYWRGALKVLRDEVEEFLRLTEGK